MIIIQMHAVLSETEISEISELIASCGGLFEFDNITEEISTNVIIKSSDPRTFWQSFKTQFDFTKHNTIVVCEGDDGWNDYLLLYHFHPEEQDEIDTL